MPNDVEILAERIADKIDTKFEKLHDRIDETDKNVAEIKAMLSGFNGFPGLVKDIIKLETDFHGHISGHSNVCLYTIEGKKKIEAIEHKLTALERKPGKTALKYLGIAVAAIIVIIATNLATPAIENLAAKRVVPIEHVVPKK